MTSWLKIKQRFVSTFYLARFLFSRVKKNTILLLEANNCHTELFPSYIKYLKDLGYNVEIAASCNQKGFLPKLDVKKVSYFSLKGFRRILNSKKVKDYDFIFSTSYRLYYPHPEGGKTDSMFFDLFKIKHSPKKGVIFTLHHLEDYDNVMKNSKSAIVLSNVLNKKDSLYTVNPCYFKENLPKNKNKEKTIFITTGALINERKNPHLLFSAARNLLDNGIENFKINIVGDNKKELMPQDLKDFIEIKGKLDFEKLYKELETADFYIPLLDPNEHLRYITTGTSGSFQLIRGFLLPPVIDKTFAIPHFFNSSNSIIYNDNESLAKAMKEAICTNNEKYLALQKSLLNSRCEIMKNATENLKNLLHKYEN